LVQKGSAVEIAFDVTGEPTSQTAKQIRVMLSFVEGRRSFPTAFTLNF